MQPFRYYPITGLKCSNIIDVDLFKEVELKIIPKTLLHKDTEYSSDIIAKFEHASAFIKIPSSNNYILDSQILKQIISIAFLSHCLSINTYDDFEENALFYLITNKLNYFTTKIGPNVIDELDYEHRIPYFDIYDQRYLPPIFNFPIILSWEKKDIVGGAHTPSLFFFSEIIKFIKKDSELSNRLYTSLIFIYDFIHHQVNINYFFVSCQILEILLLENDEICKKQKISNRITSLLFDTKEISLKKQLAEKISNLYKKRSEIVHEGKQYIDFFTENQLNLTFDINFSKNLFIKVIEFILKLNLNSIDQLKKMTKESLKKDLISSKEGYLSKEEN